MIRWIWALPTSMPHPLIESQEEPRYRVNSNSTESESLGFGPRWRRGCEPSNRSSTAQKTAMVKVPTSMKGPPLRIGYRRPPIERRKASVLGSSHDQGRIVRLGSGLRLRFGTLAVFRYEFSGLIRACGTTSLLDLPKTRSRMSILVRVPRTEDGYVVQTDEIASFAASR